MITVEERIAAWLAVIPPCIAHEHGDDQLYAVARGLFNGWGLSEAEVARWLEVYNKKCQPPWGKGRLVYKASEAAKGTYAKPRGHLVSAERVRAKPVPLSVPGKDTRRPAKCKLPEPDEEYGCYTIKSPLVSIHTSYPFTKESKGNTQASHPYPKKAEEIAPLGRQDAPSPEENSERSVTSVPSAADEETAQLAEARRIAGALAKLYEAGAISGLDDPEARFYACLLKIFSAEFVGKRQVGNCDED